MSDDPMYYWRANAPADNGDVEPIPESDGVHSYLDPADAIATAKTKDDGFVSFYRCEYNGDGDWLSTWLVDMSTSGIIQFANEKEHS